MGAWAAPQLAEADAAGVTDHRMVVAPNGTAVAVWREDRGTNSQPLSSVHARAYSPDTGWGASVVFNDTGTYDAGEPRVAINANGDAIVVWIQLSELVAGTSRGYNIASVRYKAGVWDTVPVNLLGATDIPTASISSELNSQSIALDNAGNAIFAFSVGSGIFTEPNGAWVKRYRNGVWEAAKRFLPGASTNARDVQMVATPDGTKATAIWRQYENNAGKYRVLASEYAEASGWSAGHEVDGNLALGDYSNPRLAIAANGDTTAVWEASTTGGTRTDAYASRFAGGSWSTPAIVTSISIGRSDGFIADLCSDASGNAVLVTKPFDLGQIAATRFTVGTGWAAPVQMPPDGQSFIVPQASVGCNTKGDAMVSWRAAVASPDNSYQLWARPYAPATGWGTPAQIVSLSGSSGFTLTGPITGLDDSARALTVWRQDNQAGIALNKPQSLWSSTFK
ncbi:hypothetical protein [Variovorax ginsengisoli]|uniref:Uncharacterized protein n=1 Tax=Variovorax ginsengisoli TaxID=363844 RepID=A0ABT9S8Y6_9BURK|nr:hypothetical protein [Variovorax ginsengisoli]MDP9900819.1 hypothetical protein [Variovorax ginsengisoli]